MGFYTYMWLREDGTPYYVGKGIGRRAYRKGSPSVERIILQEWASEQDAFEAEKFLIAFYGRKDLGTGILRNLTDGGDGLAGLVRSEEHCRRISKSLTGVPQPPKHTMPHTVVTRHVLSEKTQNLWKDGNYRQRMVKAHLDSPNRHKTGRKKGSTWTAVQRVAFEAAMVRRQNGCA